MRIIIDTDGSTKKTEISINGEVQKELKEFHFSMNPDKKRQGFVIEGKCKIQQIQTIDSKPKFMSFYGDDMKKIDEVTKP